LAQSLETDERWLSGRRVVVTAGGTREPIDPVRFLGNRSSGKMGNALAHVALEAGADVTLITAAEPPGTTPGLDVVRVETAQEMGDAVRRSVRGARILIMAAAVADYRPASVSPVKLKKRRGTWSLELEPTEDTPGDDSGSEVLGIWTSHIALLFGRPLKAGDIQTIYPRAEQEGQR